MWPLGLEQAYLSRPKLTGVNKSERLLEVDSFKKLPERRRY
jgi:hypothetical protein